MSGIIKRVDWNRPGTEVTPESQWMSRRRLIQLAGLAGLIGAVPLAANHLLPPQEADEKLVRKTLPKPKPPFPAPRNPAFKVDERGITPEVLSSGYNNFYELGSRCQELVTRYAY